MQPNLGTNLRRYLFQQIDDETLLSIQNEILDTFKLWLPFVQIRDIRVKTNQDDTTVGVNTIVLTIVFNIIQDPNTLETAVVAITNTAGQE